MQLRMVVAALLPHQPQISGLHTEVGQAERQFICGRRQWPNLLVEGQPAPLAVDDLEETVPTRLQRERTREVAPQIRGQEEALQRRPGGRVAIRADRCAARDRHDQQRERPHGLRTRPRPRHIGAAPFLAHDVLRATPDARRSCACWILFWSARSISRRIMSAVTGSPLQTAKWRFSRIARNASSSASRTGSAQGSAALSSTERTHSLIVCSPASASSRAYSSSVTFVLIHFVRETGMRVFLRLDSSADASDWNYTVMTFVCGKTQ